MPNRMTGAHVERGGDGRPARSATGMQPARRPRRLSCRNDDQDERVDEHVERDRARRTGSRRAAS